MPFKFSANAKISLFCIIIYQQPLKLIQMILSIKTQQIDSETERIDKIYEFNV